MSVDKFMKLFCSYRRKDTVLVPSDLEIGDYVLSLRWDAENGNQAGLLGQSDLNKSDRA